MPLKLTIKNSFRRKHKEPFDTLASAKKNEDKNLPPTKPARKKVGKLVGDKAALWNQKVENHQASQAANPFSDKYAGPAKLDKEDPGYGRPREGSLSAMRAKNGEEKVKQEIYELCLTIFDFGKRTQGGKATINFGKLFQIYNAINDKCVGLCLMARKRKLLTFEGEMLFQRRDDDKPISLLKSMNSINAYFNRATDTPDGGEVDDTLSNEIRVAVPVIEDETTPSIESKEKSPILSKPKRSIAESFRKIAKPLVEKRKPKDVVVEGEHDVNSKRWGKAIGVALVMNKWKNTIKNRET